MQEQQSKSKPAWLFYAIVLGISLIAGVVNNLISSPEKSVSWFGGQQIFETPETESYE